ncbi:adenine phosphoribosyltransferase, partial [Candidatus Peregrinibacteria bacterium CG10_big_fil_rev_8_21_14_0_10_49_16]
KEEFQEKGITKIAAPESRGFLFGCPLAKDLGVGFIPIRKPGKLPRQTMSECFMLEYGQTCMEMHHDAIQPGERVVLIDDVLATGGTANACATLIERQGGIVAGMGFLLDLKYIPQIDPIKKYDTFSLLTFTEEDAKEKKASVAARQ